MRSRLSGGMKEMRITDREMLYAGLDGQLVERVFTAQGESFILKSAPNDGRLKREEWVYDTVLPALPPIYPRLIASSLPSEEERSWGLFEDLGPLDHAFSEEKAAALIACVARWHSLPPIPGADALLQGPKPRIERMAAEVARAWESREDEWAVVGEDIGMTALVRETVSLASRRAGRWGAEPDVFSHGDLHSGNYAEAYGSIRVLDWEHAHWNSRCWDLYHLIDLSHPLFPKRVDDLTRLRLLRLYSGHAAAAGIAPDEEVIIREYRLFASVFSLWMLLLIEKDLRGGEGPWPEEKLRSQRLETLASFEQNAREL